MLIYSIIKSLLLPPGILILLFTAAFLLVRGVLGRLLLFAALSIFTLMSLSPVATLLMEPLEPYLALGTQTHIPETAQAIVILSAGRITNAPEYSDDIPDEVSLRRVRYGAMLQRNTGLPLYVSGGKLSTEVQPLSELIAEVLRTDYGITVAGIESKSQTTWENAEYTAQLLKPLGINHILLVSDAWHLPRAVEAFESTGLTVTPAPTGFVHHAGWQQELTYRNWLPSARAFQLSYYAIHEHLGRVWYQIRSWQQGAPATAV
jgi:uncharacterized SAM-binding protein YcdF (DUF218 family)